MSATALTAERSLPRKLAAPLAIVAGVLLLALGGYYLRELMGKAEPVKKPPKISLVTPTAPPPPPPPPKFEKKPEPPKEQKELKVEQPMQRPDPQPPAPTPDLKMDGPAGSGPSAFSSGTISSEDLSRYGAGKGGGGGAPAAERSGLFNPFNNFTNLAKGEVQRFLGRKEALKKRRYSLELHLWVAASGAVNRFELVGGSGDADVDEVIRQTLAALPSLSQPAPADMPMPIRLRISTGA